MREAWSWACVTGKHTKSHDLKLTTMLKHTPAEHREQMLETCSPDSSPQGGPPNSCPEPIWTKLGPIQVQLGNTSANFDRCYFFGGQIRLQKCSRNKPSFFSAVRPAEESLVSMVRALFSRCPACGAGACVQHLLCIGASGCSANLGVLQFGESNNKTSLIFVVFYMK